MNSKKHKNKNRSKVNPIPPQKQDDTEVVQKKEDGLLANPVVLKNEGSIQSIDEVKDLVAVSKDEENIDKLIEVKETVPDVSADNNESPVKPKRSKGKKKKHNVLENDQKNKVDDGKETETVKDDKRISEINPSETTIQEPCSVQPSSRKKKNKAKKCIEPSGEVLAESKSDIENSLSEQGFELDNQGEGIKNEVQIEAKALNKKNKKKKRRLDSEKQEKGDEQISCTTAFNKIIDDTNYNKNLEKETLESTQRTEDVCKDLNELIDNTSIDLVTEGQSDQCSVKKDDIVTQRKKKKDKKLLPMPKNEIHEVGETQINSDVKSEPATTGIIEKDLQSCKIEDSISEFNEPKSTIIKPVLNELSHSQGQSDTITENVGEMCELTSLEGSTSKENRIAFTDTINSPNLVEDSEEIHQPTDSANLIQSPGEQRCPEINMACIGSSTASKVDTLITEEKCKEPAIMAEIFKEVLADVKDELPLYDIKQDKKPEKSNTLEVCPENITQKELLSENLNKITVCKEFCDNIPDLIHIPRSSSQHILDDNNNDMVIQEITSVDELKLGLPILTSNIIQGSGETPVSTPNVLHNTDISVTEIESIPSKNREKTDLKSKMMEVNQDLEELKMSLEKSLAELNAIEKSDESFENESCENIDKTTEDENKSETDNPEKKSSIYKPLADRLNEIENKYIPVDRVVDTRSTEDTSEDQPITNNEDVATPPVCPSRKDRKGKGKSKKKGRTEANVSTSQTQTLASENKNTESKTDNKNKEKSKTSEEKSKQQASHDSESVQPESSDVYFEPIENFEDALTSSVEDVDVNKTFEIIASELNNAPQNDQSTKESFPNNPEINITPPVEDEEKEKQQKNDNPVSQPKNLLGHPNIPVPSSKTDYKKEKDKSPNSKQANVKIKDAVEVEAVNSEIKRSKQSQTDNKIKYLKGKNETESFSYVTNEKEEYVYKYSYRKVFLASVCHICRKELKHTRLPCKFCSLVFYCSQKHKDEDWPRHQSLCFAVSTIVHLKDQKHIYADAKHVSGQNYRLIRMQMILSCEKVLKRKLLPWEQEALLYPRICADFQCREWKQSKLLDCEGCSQVSYCIEHPEHLQPSHQRWCKSYALYQKLVLYQQLNGKLEPKLPSKVMVENFAIPAKINEILASMYEEKIDMSDIQYAALTQLATAPLTAAYCLQIYRQAFNSPNGLNKRSTLTVHAVGAELQFEADSLNKWEVFLLHLKPDVKDLRVALIGADLNPSNLPLDLLGKIKLCESCRMNKRRVQFSFQDKKSYYEFWASDAFTMPDIVCAFNPSIQRSTIYNGIDSWSSTLNCVMKQKIPFLITSHTLEELNRDLACIDNYTEINYKVISEPKQNPFASVRPDRNFLSDDETPLLFKNYCFSVLCGV